MQFFKTESVALNTINRSLRSDENSVVTIGAHHRVPIFYNLFVKDKTDISRVSQFMREQLETYMKPGVVHGPVTINSVGAVENLKTLKLFPEIEATLNHYAEGDEEITLQDVWEFCSREDTHPEQKVIYLHSKGSFTQKASNDVLRVYLTKGALSSECSSLPDTCNVCSSRMSPIPHPHVSGNMWLARCDYIRKLIEPKNFKEAMAPPKPKGG